MLGLFSGSLALAVVVGLALLAWNRLTRDPVPGQENDRAGGLEEAEGGRPA